MSSSPVSIAAVQSARALPAQWESLCGEAQIALSLPFLRAFEAACVEGVESEFLLAERSGRVVAGAALHRVEIRLDEQRFSWTAELVRQARDLDRPDLLRFRGLICGLNASQGRDDVASGPEPPTPEAVLAFARHAEDVAWRQDLDGVVFGHLHPDRLRPFRVLEESGYVLLPSLPYATLPVRWRSLDEYLALLRAGYRRQALADLRGRERAGLVVCPALDLGAHAEELLPLYRGVVDRAEQRIEILNSAFFRELASAFPGQAELLGLRHEGRLVAGAVLLHRGRRLFCLEVGLDYSWQADAELYTNLLLSLVERAGVLGVAHLDLGQTAMEAKARIGACLVPTWFLVKARSPMVAAALRVGRPHLRPDPLPHRRVFREDGVAGESPALQAEIRPASDRTDDERLAGGGDYARHVNPDLASRLALFRLDRVYVRGEGTRLWDAQGREVLDFTSGYGALPFGHNPSFVWEAVMELQARDAAQMVQGALSSEAGELAHELCRHAPPGIRYAVFANSGAEAVEVAIKAARAAKHRPLIVVAEGAFHGKTLGALSATGSSYYQEPFYAPAPGFPRVPYGDADALERVLAERRGEVAAFLVEPILGEGGIVVPPPGYLRAARAACDRHDALLLCDEVQTGLGRTGHLFACQEDGITPDAIAVSKALGGGLVPAAACLLSAAAWSEALGLRHSSTFAGNALAATVGLAVLRHLTAEGGVLLAEVRRKGELLRTMLAETARRCPALAEVRGRGLMIGLEVGALEDVGSPVLRHLAREQKLVPLLCSYLLCRHGVRVMPPLSRRTALRLIPPLDVSEGDLIQVAEALEDTFARLQAGDTYALSCHLLDGVTAPSAVPASAGQGLTVGAAPPMAQDSAPRAPTRRAEQPAGRFVFLLHPLDLDHYRQIEPSLAPLEDPEVASFDRLLRDLVEAAELSHVRLRSAAGALCEGWFVGLPLTAAGLAGLTPQESLRWLRAGMTLAKRKGANIVGLGAFTSVASRGGLALRSEGIGLTTGNAYTVAAACEALLLAAEAMAIDPHQATCAVVGANGAIGRVCSRLLARTAHRLLLVGNPAKADASRRLEALAAELRSSGGNVAVIHCTVDARAALSEAELVLSATSAVGPLLEPSWLRSGSAVCDVAQPSDVSREVAELRNDVLVIDGGVVRLPEPISLGWDFELEPGFAYACMAETMILALDGHRGHYSLGARLTAERAQDIAARAARHGFHVASFRSFGRPVPPAQIEAVRKNAHGGGDQTAGGASRVKVSTDRRRPPS